MFSRFFTILPVAALAAVAAAAPNTVEARNGGSSSNCSSGSIYCCNQKFADPTSFTGIIGGLLTAVVGATVPIGLTCDPITVIGLGNGAQCTTQTACCTGNNVNGLVNVVCSPINVNV